MGLIRSKGNYFRQRFITIRQLLSLFYEVVAELAFLPVQRKEKTSRSKQESRLRGAFIGHGAALIRNRCRRKNPMHRNWYFMVLHFAYKLAFIEMISYDNSQ